MMVNRRVALVTAALGLSGCSTALGPADPTNIGSLMEFYEVPGASVAVIKDFQLDYVEVHGVKSRSTLEPVTESTLFQSASLTKSVTAMGVLRLVQDGVLSLDAEANDYLTSWTVKDNGFQDSEKVTLRRLLSHTAGTTVSGFRGYRQSEPVPTLIQILNGHPPANSAPVVVDRVPGSDFRYSGGGFLIAQQVVMDVTGSSFPDFIRERVLDPIGLSNSTLEQPLPDSLLDRAASGYYANGVAVPGGFHTYPEIAAGGWWTTASDVARFITELQLSLRGESNKVLSQANAELLVAEVRNDYGLGLALRSEHGQQYFWHAGANDGTRCAMIAHTSRGYGVVILTNSDNGEPKLTEAVFELIGRREGWPGY